QDLSCYGIPYPYDFILASCGDTCSIRAVADFVNASIMSLQRHQQRAGVRIPDSRRITAAQQPRPIRTVDDLAWRTWKRKRKKFLTCMCVNNLSRVSDIGSNACPVGAIRGNVIRAVSA